MGILFDDDINPHSPSIFPVFSSPVSCRVLRSSIKVNSQLQLDGGGALSSVHSSLQIVQCKAHIAELNVHADAQARENKQRVRPHAPLTRAVFHFWLTPWF